MSDENTGGALDIYTGPDTGTDIDIPDGAPATEGDSWQMPAEPDGPLDIAGNPEHLAYAVDAMSYWDRDENGALVDNQVARLKAEWGSDMAANLAFGEAFGRAHPDILGIIYDAGMSEADDGNMVAAKECGDRLDGKSVQGVELGVAVTITAIERRIVDPLPRGTVVELKPIEHEPEEGENG